MVAPLLSEGEAVGCEVVSADKTEEGKDVADGAHVPVTAGSTGSSEGSDSGVEEGTGAGVTEGCGSTASGVRRK